MPINFFPGINVQMFGYIFPWDKTFYGLWKNTFITPGMYASGVKFMYTCVGTRDTLLRDVITEA